MGNTDGRVWGPATSLIQSGNDEDKLVIVIVAEGFRDIEFGDFHNHCSYFRHRLQNEPWYYGPDSKTAINLYYLFVSANDSGIDDPVECGGTGATPATYFDGTFCPTSSLSGRPGRLPRRVVRITHFALTDVLTEYVPTWDIAIVLCNSTVLGGATTLAARPVITLTVHQGWVDSALHELGHAAFDLLDEYDYFSSCATDGPEQNRAPAGAEPLAANVTRVNDPARLKWRHLLTPDVAVPTMENPDCTTCDRRPNVLLTPATIVEILWRNFRRWWDRLLDAVGGLFGGHRSRRQPRYEVNTDDLKVGLFEGANFVHCGFYRPVYRCRMRDQRQPFCPVCREQIDKILESYR